MIVGTLIVGSPNALLLLALLDRVLRETVQRRNLVEPLPRQIQLPRGTERCGELATEI
jgi:hypothetical protein